MKRTSTTPEAPRASGRHATAPVRILAVDPGTRYMGVAFFVGPELVRADVENVREPGMRPREVAEKATRVLTRWIERYQPEILAVENTFFAQSRESRALRRLIATITALGRQEQLTVQVYLPTTVRRFVCPHGRPTRLAVARTIATEHFHWLYPRYQKEAGKSWWRKHYWTHMFDAIAVGLACRGRLSSRRPRHHAT